MLRVISRAGATLTVLAGLLGALVFTRPFAPPTEAKAPRQETLATANALPHDWPSRVIAGIEAGRPPMARGEIERLLEAAHGAGAASAGYTLMRLPYEIKDLFAQWLDSDYGDVKTYADDWVLKAGYAP